MRKLTRFFKSQEGPDLQLRIPLWASHVSDGRWHRAQVKWMQNETWISLDHGQLELTRAHHNYRVGAVVSEIRAGGPGADGCVKVGFLFFFNNKITVK